MKQKEHTKRALCMSILSMLLCCSMLIGSTFAWFTDSVTSGKNKIVAGNLDVELYHGDGTDEGDKVTGATTLFATDVDGSPILWEPGAIVYEKFTVKNEGSLALKYKLALKDLVKNYVVEHDAGAATKTERSLTDVIKVAVTDGAVTRDSVETMTFTGLDEFVVPTGTLMPKGESGADDSFNVVLYWAPSDDDDLYNLKNGRTASDLNGEHADELTIEFGVELTASQYTYESDSFDDRYDGSATDGNDDIIVLTSESKLVSENNAFTFTMPGNTATGEGELTVQFPAGSLDDGTDAHTVELIAETQKPYAGEETDPAKQAIANVELTLLVDDEEVHTFNGKTVTVTTYVPKDLLNVEVVYKGSSGDEVLDGTIYDKNTGKLTFQTNHFSLFEVRSDRLMTEEEEQKAAEGYIFKVDDNYYKDLDEFATVLNSSYKRYKVPVKDGGTFKILADTDLKYTLCIGEGISEDVTVDLTGHTVTFLRTKGETGDALGFNVQYSAKHVTIKNGAIKAWNTGSSGGAAVFGREGSFTLRNLDITNIGCTSSGNHYALICGSDSIQQNEIYDCTIHGYVLVANQTNLKIYDSVIEGTLEEMSSAFGGELYVEGVTVLGDLYNSGRQSDGIIVKSGHFKNIKGPYTLAEGSTVSFNETTGMYDVIAG